LLCETPAFGKNLFDFGSFLVEELDAQACPGLEMETGRVDKWWNPAYPHLPKGKKKGKLWISPGF
jgi:hypothetical protein